MSPYRDPFSLRAEEIARQAILRADSLGMEHYGSAPAKQEISGPSGGVIQFSDLERANRLRFLIEKAKALQAEAGVKKGE